MCGICGYISKNRLDDSILRTMRDTMVHRGPNDEGVWQIKGSSGYIGLAHRRLSVIDLSERGHQPMLYDDGRLSIVFNGEIYNYREIRTELEKEGYLFKSDCDTEVILYAYDKWKEECFSRFNGMFAIAIWDSSSESMIIARDRLGVKPLYYYYNQLTGDFVFASELKPIMKYPLFSKDIDLCMLGSYLCNKYIASPNTIFVNTYKLEPGTFGIYRDDSFKISKYWDITKEKNNATREMVSDFYTCKKEIESILIDAVKIRLSADVPVGSFLSGGVDSSLVTAIAQRVSNEKVKTFTIGFHDENLNEANKARQIAKYLNTDHTEMYIGEREMMTLLDDITKYYDEPFADSSQLPTMLVSQLASQNVTVAISGDGGDEVFCGYKMYDLVKIAQIADPIGNFLGNIISDDKISRIHDAKIRAFLHNRNNQYKTQLFSEVFADWVSKMLPGVCFLAKHRHEEGLDYSNWQERRMVLDLMTYLPDEIMAKTDRASMKYSLEVRSPLLDYRLVEKSFRIPHDFKYRHSYNCSVTGIKKYILKSLAFDYIPRELLSGPKKGFGVPLKRWLRGPLKEEIEKYSEPGYVRRQGIFDESVVLQLVSRQKRSDNVLYSSLLWSYYMFQRWWESYMEK